VSPEIGADRRVTFRIYAPNAQAIRLAAGDIPGVGQATQLTKGENGVWQVTVGPIDPGRLSLQLQRRRRRDDRPAQQRHQRVEHQRLEPVLRVRLGLHGHA
jgi:1,4-alpha-glucan branching enzyme